MGELGDLVEKLRRGGVEVMYSSRLTVAGAWLAEHDLLILGAAHPWQDLIVACQDALLLVAQAPAQ